jgi:uncharacterized integral membrane protein
MPWKLVLWLILLALVLAFVGFNIENTSDISFGFYTLSDIPIFVSLFGAFVLGVLISVPVTVRHASRRRTKRSKQKRDEAASPETGDFAGDQDLQGQG